MTGASLDRLGRHVFDPEVCGRSSYGRKPSRPASGWGADDIRPGLEAHCSRAARARRRHRHRNMLPTWARGVPLRRVLQGQDHAVVARHVHEQAGLIVLVRKLNRQPFSSPVGESTGGSRPPGSARCRRAGSSGQAEAERNAFLHFGDAFEHLFLRRDEIEGRPS